MARRDTEVPPLMAALRADRRSFAVFATVLIALQLLLSGLGLGKAAAEVALFGPATICSQSEGGAHSPAPSGHRDCPCLAAGCFQPTLAVLPSLAPREPADLRRLPPRTAPAVEACVERRPLAVLGRAGRGPPPLS